MASLVEILPLLFVALLLIAAGGGDVESVEVAVDGDRTVTDLEDVLIVGGGTATVPAGEQVEGSLYVVGGDVTVAGMVEGDVIQLAGNVTVAASGTVGDELRLVAGEQVVEAGASVGRRTDVTTVVPAERSPVEQAVSFAVPVAALALAGWALARRNPTLLGNVGDAVVRHGLVSATVGALASATGVALVVFMAMTVLLLPVSLLGLLVGVVVIAYAYLAFGYLVGRRLPIESAGGATVAGVVAFAVGIELLGRVPVVGALVQLVVVLAGIGAVLITYFGLREFTPAELPE